MLCVNAALVVSTAAIQRMPKPPDPRPPVESRPQLRTPIPEPGCETGTPWASRAAIAAFGALVVASFAAFFVIHRVKSEPALIRVGGLSRYFSPACDCDRRTNEFWISLGTDDRVTVDVVRADGSPVRRLTTDRVLKAYRRLVLAWDGTLPSGQRAPDGLYRIRVRVPSRRRVAVIQTTMRLDTVAPRPVLCVGEVCSSDAGDRAIRVSKDRPVDIRIKGRSKRYATQVVVRRREQGRWIRDREYEVTSPRLRISPASTTSKARRYEVVVAVRDRAGNFGSARLTLAPSS